MDSAEKAEQMLKPADFDSASASDSLPRDTIDAPYQMTSSKSADAGHPDQSERSVSPVFAVRGSTQCHVEQSSHSNTSSPRHHSDTDLRQEHLFGSSGSDTYGPGDPDLEHFYRLTAQRFIGPGISQEEHYDDLPLTFSFQSGEDDSSKVYSCNICNFKTAFKNSLVNHQAVHSDARPWICDVCDYAAKRKQDLKKHLQTMHGMIVDSLALKPGVNPPASSVSSGGASSPADIKPVIVNNAVMSGDHCSAGMVGFGGPQSLNAASLLSQQQAMLGFGQPLPSSAKMNFKSKSLPMPVVGKFIADKFPFNQFGDDGMISKAMPRYPSETFTSHTRPTFEVESDAESTEREASSLENFSSKRFQMMRDWVGGQPGSLKSHRKDSTQTEDRDRSRLHSGNEMLSREDEHASTGILDPGNSHSDVSDSEMQTRSRSDARTSTSSATVSSHTEELGLMQRHKRTSSDSPSGRISGSDQSTVPPKMPKFRSPTSDNERSPQVSSQSDHSGNVEAISSSVSYSHALETKKSFHCVHCDILFFENALYLMHMGLHDNSNPWKCSICGRTFFEKYSFTSHFINQH